MHEKCAKFETFWSFNGRSGLSIKTIKRDIDSQSLKKLTISGSELWNDSFITLPLNNFPSPSRLLSMSLPIARKITFHTDGRIKTLKNIQRVWGP